LNKYRQKKARLNLYQSCSKGGSQFTKKATPTKKPVIILAITKKKQIILPVLPKKSTTLAEQFILNAVTVLTVCIILIPITWVH